MKSVFCFSTAVLAAFCSAAPTKRADGPTDGIFGPRVFLILPNLLILDILADILNYALTLEHLEDTFYRQGLANFTADDFKDAGYTEDAYSRIQKVASDEASHVKFITDALTAAGGKPVAECTYAFGVTDVKSFLATASILEGKMALL